MRETSLTQVTVATAALRQKKAHENELDRIAGTTTNTGNAGSIPLTFSVKSARNTESFQSMR